MFAINAGLLLLVYSKIKINNMKKLAYVSGALTSMMALLGILFKIMIWPGASILLVLGIAGFALIFIPSFAKYKYDKE